MIAELCLHGMRALELLIPHYDSICHLGSQAIIECFPLEALMANQRGRRGLGQGLFVRLKDLWRQQQNVGRRICCPFYHYPPHGL